MYVCFSTLDRLCQSDVYALRSAAWSVPSAIGTAGFGVGTQPGTEITDFLIVFNTESVSAPRLSNIPHVYQEPDT